MASNRTMTCMEIWGGSDAVDAAVHLPGLDAWVISQPYQGSRKQVDVGQNDESSDQSKPAGHPQQVEDGGGGGDVYYVSSCATGRINRLLLADVSGHGEVVRGIALQLRDLMRKYVNVLDQSRFVSSMNGRFVECSAACCFATAIVTTFFAPTRTLSLCNAGHPPPLLFRAGTREWSFAGYDLPQGNIPLGILDYDTCEQFDLRLDVGDLIVLYTDCLIEARAPDGEMLQTAGLLALAREVLDPNRPELLSKTLLAAIDQRTAGGLHADDATVLVLRPNGSGSHASLRAGLTAGLRIAASIGRALAGNGPMSLPELSIANIGGAVFAPLNRMWRPKRLLSKSARRSAK